MAEIWYEKASLSKANIKEISDLLAQCSSYGTGYFDILSHKSKEWRLISEEERQKINLSIGILGGIRKKLFYYEEVLDEVTEEINKVRRSYGWSQIAFTKEEEMEIRNIQIVMAHYVERDNWPTADLLGKTHVYALDGYSFFSYLTRLADDWVDEQKISRSNSFVKMLIKTGYWGEDQALISISKRAINEQGSFSWESSEEIEEIAGKISGTKRRKWRFQKQIRPKRVRILYN